MENTQFALVATVHKLYAMVRAAQAWELGEPELNERGQPVIHSIASKLGCIRPNNDPDLPMGSSVFPENEQDLAELASQLENHQQKREAEQAVSAAAAAAVAAAAAATQAESQSQNDTQAANAVSVTMPSSAPGTMVATNGALDFSLGSRFDRASSSEDLDGFSDMDDYRKNVFGGGNGNGSSVNSASTTMSPQSHGYTDFEVVSNQSDGFAAPSPTMPSTQFTNWMAQPTPIDMGSANMQQPQAQQQLMHMHLQRLQQQQQEQQQIQRQQLRQRQQQQQQQQQDFKQLPLSLSIPTSMATSSMGLVGSDSQYYSVDMLRQGLVESNFGALKPHIMTCENPNVMLGNGDPMIFGGDFDDNPM